ncbi:tetratricopeptide repeat domain-containing protein [Penicillium hispanicum]|uniref:tetratricopeptide repeat domain-containing protein n=1 Tax=Penicillium hispanicum TaxID=1080232 RepID=UPI002540D2F3|nr:tetratricopeptide repeat domain-containing protein [Penicillium hispanicum]KAJ5569877.1 tetratricopeptide repeat domain-containing protein [Penicillium hispanicum]
MDPFSLTVGALSLADACWRILKFLREIPTAVATQKEIETLISEVESLRAIVVSVKECLDARHTTSAITSPLQAGSLEDLLNLCKQTINTCQNTTTQLESLVQEIYGRAAPRSTGKLDGLSKELRRRDKATDIQRLRDQLSYQKQNLQILLTGFDLHYHQISHDTLDQISINLRSQAQSFRLQIETLEDRLEHSGGKNADKDKQDIATLSRTKKFLDSVKSVANAVSATRPNMFFDIPQPVSSVYTGRNEHLTELQEILLASSVDEPPKQQRFVICGIGGSGKTQFSCKFAEQNRESFWGVFWIDASSHERTKQTYVEIAKFGKVEPNHHAAMHWLSNREERWLLLMDNADDPGIDLQDYFPKGDRGHIIITTRNPAHKIYGNVGPRYFEFEGMEGNDASALLLRAARLAEPWDPVSSSWATKITKQLGYLALALVHAGAAIRNGLCSLRDYLTFYDQDWERIRRIRRSSLWSGDQYERNMSALATYELSYRGIEQKGTEESGDAIQLLKMFSFFYFKNIRFDILEKAVSNCQKEKQQQEEADQEEPKVTLTWYQKYNQMRMLILGFIAQDRGPSTLPRFIREGRESGFFDGARLRYALKELVQMSLITYHESNNSYSMHPLVHRWARERPGMSTPEQAVWSHIAATTLAHSILLPPYEDTEAEELFRRDILPHIDHVRSCQGVIERRIMENRRRRWYGLVQWPGAGSGFGRSQAVLYAKFSIVFAQNGRWNEAEELQLCVKAYADKVLGLGHPRARAITLALATTYWNQGRGDEASDLQDAVLQACIASLGPGSHETLMTMDTLGQTRWQQGRYSEARVLQKHAVEGLLKLKGLKHENTLTAMGGLGRTVAKFYERQDLDEAKQLLTSSAREMSNLLGPTHLKTLVVKEDLAMLSLLTEENLLAASHTMRQVLQSREDKLGKEHPYTLLAMVNLARLNSALGEYNQAEALIRRGLPIADRNLGEDHIGTLMGRTVLGTILIGQSRLAEAESTLLKVIESQRHLSSYRGDFHPDRLGAMMELARCYRLQEKLDEAIQLSDEIIEGLESISLKEHPLERKTKLQKRELMEVKRAGGWTEPRGKL